MCFSATASFTAAAILGATGTASVTQARKSDLLYASIPWLFAVQQLTEGVIWVSLASPGVLAVAKVIYLFFSHILWPTVIPLSILLMEKTLWRRQALGVCTAVGVVVSAYFLYFLFTEDVSVQVVNESIAYVSPYFLVTFILSPYTVATCASCLFSSYRWVNAFGIVAFFSALLTFRFYDQTFVSVWCFFAAVLSVIVLVQVVTSRRKPS